MNYGGAQDNDMWWLFATGREIVENGFPYTNPFDIYGDQAIVVQQWLACVIDYVVYDSLGFAGIGIMTALLSLALAAALLALYRSVAGRAGMETACIVAAVVIGCASSYLSIRPQVWSMLAYVLIVMVLERYRTTNNKKVLIWLPVIMAVHANLHMSLALFDIAIACAYLLPDFSGEGIRGKFSGYNRGWLLAAIVGMCAASLLSPYGIDGAMYFFDAIGAASYGDYISEMGTLAPYNQYYGMCMLAMVVVGGITAGRMGWRHMDVPLLCLFLVTTVMSVQHVRNVWLVAIFAYALFAVSCADKPVCLQTKWKLFSDDVAKYVVSAMCCIVIVALGTVQMTSKLVEEPVDSMSTPVAAADYMDSQASEGDVNVFTHFNAGGYLEWRGYKVSMDARPELWNDAIANSGQDRYTEYIDMTREDISSAEYMTGKQFDYMIVNSDTALYRYMLGSLDYDKVLDGDGYALFKTKSAGIGAGMGATGAFDAVSDESSEEMDMNVDAANAEDDTDVDDVAEASEAIEDMAQVSGE